MAAAGATTKKEGEEKKFLLMHFQPERSMEEEGKRELEAPLRFGAPEAQFGFSITSAQERRKKVLRSLKSLLLFPLGEKGET